jgi:hypothetical protein
MDTVVPQSDVVWYCEDHVKDREQHGPAIDKAIGPEPAVRQTSTRALQIAMQEARHQCKYPWLVISDTLVTLAQAGNQSPAEVLGTESPFTITYLFSNSAYNYPKLAEWVQRGVVARVRRKTHQQDMLDDIRTFAARWNLPEIVRFREHVLAAGERANLRYFPRGDGENLNLYDLHREMVLGTPLGVEQAHIWDVILRGDLAPLGVRPRRTDERGHVLDTAEMEMELAGHIITVPPATDTTDWTDPTNELRETNELDAWLARIVQPQPNGAPVGNGG